MRVPLVLAALALAPPARAGSVYELSIARDGAITAAALGLTVALYALSDELITPRCPCDPREVPAFDRWVLGSNSSTAARVSDATVLLATVGPLGLDWGDAGSNRARLEDAAVVAEALAVTGALVTLTKYLVQRPLPRTYDGDPDLVAAPRGYRAFFSGHTAITAAALSTWAMTRRERHGAEAWPWVVAGLVTASVAGERVAAGSHFPSDVVVGAAVGTVVGLLVPRLHERSRSSAPPAAASPLVGFALAF
jgi:membrane-associated phospholipid phosphatase